MKPKYAIKNDITLFYGWGMKVATFPKGTLVEVASNLPEGAGFWVKSIPKGFKSNREFASWFETYGFLIDPSEVVACK